MKLPQSITLRYLAGTVILLALWAAGSAALGPEILPDPMTVIVHFAHSMTTGEFLRHFGLSSLRLGEAILVAIATGFPLGLAFGMSSRLDWIGAPLTFITLPLPKIVLLPVFFTIFGLGDLSRVLLIALATGFQILVVVREAGLSLDPAYEMSLKSMGATIPERIIHAYLPAALPSLFTALKAASGTAMAVLFLAESFATDAGLGWFIMDAWGMGDIEGMFVGILAMSVLGLLLYALIGIAERVFCRWQHI
ncbi:ABC transporter permease [Sutterella sp.]|uniref:ABC transporter permease n=1 Tax=Sutterella sp. TaxID=1981025 RepID=UPI0026DFED46|nr:ABC transporter permease subunit [Sutterella sp.]MDO5532294.1 ABC transporter permease subunit [Sutterella sp.]